MYYDKDDKDHALADFETAIKLSVNDLGAIYMRGHVYDDKGEKDRALTDYNEAIRTRSQIRQRL